MVVELVDELVAGMVDKLENVSVDGKVVCLVE
jgi:hypothetical protein